ncbi:MAG: helix-turn-helix domain-containing protein, partial [Verrucomicrobia bacterium]|nr:helix-turn-helix domain-containing protein [Verrucomicrobiota bacterium]
MAFAHARRMAERMISDVLTKPEAAKALKISVPTISRLIARGELAAIRIGERCVRVDPTALALFIIGRSLEAIEAAKRKRG